MTWGLHSYEYKCTRTAYTSVLNQIRREERKELKEEWKEGGNEARKEGARKGRKGRSWKHGNR